MIVPRTPPRKAQPAPQSQPEQKRVLPKVSSQPQLDIPKPKPERKSEKPKERSFNLQIKEDKLYLVNSDVKPLSAKMLRLAIRDDSIASIKIHNCDFEDPEDITRLIHVACKKPSLAIYLEYSINPQSMLADQFGLRLVALRDELKGQLFFDDETTKVLNLLKEKSNLQVKRRSTLPSKLPSVKAVFEELPKTDRPLSKERLPQFVQQFSHFAKSKPVGEAKELTGKSLVKMSRQKS